MIPYRMIFTSICFWLALCFTSLAIAQDASNATSPAAQEQVEPTAEVVESDEAPEVEVEIDPAAALADKLNALETAEREAFDAFRTAREAGLDITGIETAADVDGLDDAAGDTTSLLDPAVLREKGEAILAQIVDWLKSPSFLAQVGAIFLIWLIAPLIAATLRKRVFFFREPPEEGAKLQVVQDYLYRSRVFLRAIINVALLALAAVILKAIPALGQDWLVKIAQGLAVVFLLYQVIKTFVLNEMFQKLALWTVIPLALIIVFGFYDNLLKFLDSVQIMAMGDKPITLMTVTLLLIFGAIFFKLGGVANAKGQRAIRSQESFDSATREVVSKIFQIVLFSIIFIMVLGAAKVPLSGLVVIFSALSLGVGLGLQPIAANFVSGMIILFDRSVRVGDFVVLPDGQEGFVEAINMRSTVVETTDGKDIMVPNTTFTENTYENWTHKDPRQRYEVHFSVAYDTDLDVLEDLIIPEFLKHPSVLEEPEMPDLEFREFGENGVKMAIEFWCSGIDDGPNKFTSDLNFVVWRILRDNNIDVPLPQRVVHMNKS